MQPLLDTKAHLDPCLVVAGDDGLRRQYVSKLAFSGYTLLEAQTSTEALRLLKRPLLATIIIDWFSPFDEDLLSLVRGVCRPRAPMIVVHTGARFTEIARCAPEYVVHCDDEDPAQLRLTLEAIEECARRASIEELEEPPFKIAAE